MKYEIQLDENNYVCAIVHTGDDVKDIYDDDFVFNTFYKDGHRPNCYYLKNDEYILDEIKEKEEIEKEEQEREKEEKESLWLEAQVTYTAMMTDTLLEE